MARLSRLPGVDKYLQSRPPPEKLGRNVLPK
jgi:hypothetical protein